MLNERRQGGGEFFIGAVVISLALVICAFIAKSALITVKGFGQAITVTGAAIKPISSDFAIWEGRVQSSAATLESAYAKLDKGFAELLVFLTSNGIADKDFEAGATQLNKSQDRETGAITFMLARQIKLQSSDLDKIKTLSIKSSELIEKGIEFISQNPRFICTSTEDLKIEMIKSATENAKLRAEQLALSTGRKIGAPTMARVGVFQIRPRNSQEVSDYGINDVSSLEKEIVCTVQVGFLIE